MKKHFLNIFELLTILFVFVICGVFILQIGLLSNRELFGYKLCVNSFVNSNYKLYGDIVLVKNEDINDINVGDVVTYVGKSSNFVDEVITNEVVNILDVKGEKYLEIKGKDLSSENYFIKNNQIYGVYVHKFILMSFISKSFNSSMGFIMLILLPLIVLVGLELYKRKIENKRKNMIKSMEFELEKLEAVESSSKLCKTIENTINEHIKELEESRGDIEKINNLDDTIQISLDDIQKRIDELNSIDIKKSKTKKVGEDTVILFTKDDIKEAIKKDLKDSKSKDNTKKVINKNVKSTGSKNSKNSKSTDSKVTKVTSSKSKKK